MTLADGLRFLMRVVHTGALAIWFGGGLLYVITRPILRPALTSDAWNVHEATLRLVSRRCFALLLASGAYLVFDRLADPRVGITYVVVLTLKIVLVAAVAWVTVGRRPIQVGSRRTGLASTAWLVSALGAGALLLGVALTAIYEADVARP